MSEPRAPRYNPLFERFVDASQPDPEMLPGMVAYCLYKLAKREWATDFFERNGRKPNDDELQEYIRTWTPTRVSGAEKEAEAVLLAFAGSVIENNAPQIREEALRGTFWKSVWTSCVAAGIYTLFLIFVAVVLRSVGIDLLSTVQAVGGR
ncbi:hypothetical protein E3C22_15160 [Jiella endophytica]|uniref:Transmembrane protein n=1 Tax=Jiella endophytica TaxID=2558362 RepID=A0A4Y8RJH0_9HYPH|nr:hypothetical protein [Jiella endophytica]TFF21987.1 hypothetical protein E3C22_15160 [Jiella endophytica]